MRLLRQNLRRLGRDRRGATAVEFALLIGPFLFLLLGLMEVSMQYFIATAMDYAVQRTARLIRTGQAQETSLSVDELRATMCQNMLDIFDCPENSYLSVTELDNLDATSATLPVDSSGNFLDSDIYEAGHGGSYVIVRGYFQFSPLFDIFGALTPQLANGNRIVAASALFRNEPF